MKKVFIPFFLAVVIIPLIYYGVSYSSSHRPEASFAAGMPQEGTRVDFIIEKTDQKRPAHLDPPWFAEELNSLAPRSDTISYSIEKMDFSYEEESLQNRLFSSYAQALEYATENAETQAIVSANMIGALTKEVFDGVYAAIELALEKGMQGHWTRSEILVQLREALVKEKTKNDVSQVVLDLLSGAELAKMGKPDGNPLVNEFLRDPNLSKPVGFYTWNETLEQIFRRDRFLQKELDLIKNKSNFELLRSVLQSDKNLRSHYEFQCRYLNVMANPFAACSFLDEPGSQGRETWSVFPAMRANETELQKKILFEERRSVLDPMDEMITRVKDGRLSLEPKPDSGFYDYQQSALEGLLLPNKNPEGTKVRFGDRYRQRLEEAFRAGMAKARETYSKDRPAKLPPIAPPPHLVHRPFIPLEPLATVYFRYALAFDFLAEKLDRLIGRSLLEKITFLDYGQQSSTNVWREITQARELFFGLALIGCDEIGLNRGKIGIIKGLDEKTAAKMARSWMSNYHQDKRIYRDARFAVPISIEKDTSDKPVFIHYWGTAGVFLVKVDVEFTEGVSGILEASKYLVTADKFISFKRKYERGPLTRDEVRAIFDKSKSLTEALARLEQ
jgi:hypothetical protein